jgi:hypothetical protein
VPLWQRAGLGPHASHAVHEAEGGRNEVVSALWGRGWVRDVWVGENAVADGLGLPIVGEGVSMIFDVVVSIVVPVVVGDGGFEALGDGRGLGDA